MSPQRLKILNLECFCHPQEVRGAADLARPEGENDKGGGERGEGGGGGGGGEKGGLLHVHLVQGRHLVSCGKINCRFYLDKK